MMFFDTIGDLFCCFFLSDIGFGETDMLWYSINRERTEDAVTISRLHIILHIILHNRFRSALSFNCMFQ